MMKIGLEVEGRSKGLKTLFLKASPNLTSAFLTANLYKVPHIYISVAESDMDIDTVVSMLENDYPDAHEVLITVESTVLPTKPLEKHSTIDHFMFSITSGVHQLRPTDTVKSHDGNLNVLTCTVENMSRTEPMDFAGDLEVKPCE